MFRFPATLATLLVLATLPALSVDAANPCPDQPIHSYHISGSGKDRSVRVLGNNGVEVGFVTVSDSNTSECDGDPNTTADWDGDYDWGVGGGAFGYGQWAEDADCNYALNVHGGNVAVNDVVFGSNIWFLVGEDDQSGPIKIQDPLTFEWICLTSGTISPCPAWGCDPLDPTQDADDCLSPLYTGFGATCGTGGGDGLYWVIFPYEAYCDGGECRVNPNQSSEAVFVTAGNPAVAGTITAY